LDLTAPASVASVVGELGAGLDLAGAFSSSFAAGFFLKPKVSFCCPLLPFLERSPFANFVATFFKPAIFLFKVKTFFDAFFFIFLL